VLVFGGTGELGSEIVKDLLQAKEKVTVFSRVTSKKSRLKDLEVLYVEGDVLNEKDVENALKSGPYKVIVDALARDSNVDPDFYDTSMEYISKWAKQTGVSQVILHGSVGAGLSKNIYPKERLEVMGPTLNAKDFGERHLIESGVNYTIIRNMVLLPLEVRESGEAYLSTDQNKRGMISRDGLARLTLECMNQNSCINEIFHAVDEKVEPPGRYRELMKTFME